jgi:uncharacterized protein with HEPN domain
MKRYKEYARHIWDEIKFLREEATGITLDQLLRDEMRRRAFVRSLEIIGEAVKNIPASVKEQYPQIEWRRIAGTRDRLIHHYFQVDYKIVWNIIQVELPPLEKAMQDILKDEPKGLF